MQEKSIDGNAPLHCAALFGSSGHSSLMFELGHVGTFAMNGKKHITVACNASTNRGAGQPFTLTCKSLKRLCMEKYGLRFERPSAQSDHVGRYNSSFSATSVHRSTCQGWVVAILTGPSKMFPGLFIQPLLTATAPIVSTMLHAVLWHTPI